MKISENRHRSVEVKRSHDCAMLVEDSENMNIVILHPDEIPATIRELQRIYEEIKHDEGEMNSIMHDPPIPF